MPHFQRLCDIYKLSTDSIDLQFKVDSKMTSDIEYKYSPIVMNKAMPESQYC